MTVTHWFLGFPEIGDQPSTTVSELGMVLTLNLDELWLCDQDGFVLLAARIVCIEHSY